MIQQLVSCAAVVAALAVTFCSEAAAAPCVRNTPPPTFLQAELKSAAFAPGAIADPLLQFKLTDRLASVSSFSIEYSKPVERGVAPVTRAPIDPTQLQILENMAGETFVDLRAVPLASETYKQARIVITAPTEIVHKPLLDSAAVVKSLSSRNDLLIVKDAVFGGQAIGISLSALPAITGGAPTPEQRLRDALVMIRTAGGLCNGTYIGSGRVVTARHCLSGNMQVVFGDVWLPPGTADVNAVSGDIVCQAKSSAIVSAPPSPGAPPMDVALIELASGFEGTAGIGRFTGAALELNRISNAPGSYRLAAAWTNFNQPIAWTPDHKPFAPKRLAKNLFRPPEGGGDAGNSWCQGRPPPEDPDCMPMQHEGISKAGWRHRCPVVGGVSGAPLFDGASSDLKVVAVVTGDGREPDNCAARVSALPAFE